MRKRQAFTEYGYRWVWTPKGIGRWLRWLWREAHWFVERGWYGYAATDTWSWYTYMTDVNLGGLSILRRNHHGSPQSLCDLDQSGMPLCIYERKGCGCCHERWAEQLDLMIDGFRAIEESEHDLLEGEWEVRAAEREDRFKRGMAAYTEHFGALWD